MMTEIEQLEQSVLNGKSLIELMKHEDFDRLFIKDQEAKLLEIGYSMTHLDEVRKAKAIKEMEAISYFFERMYEIINSGNIAQGNLNDIAEEAEYNGE